MHLEFFYVFNMSGTGRLFHNWLAVNFVFHTLTLSLEHIDVSNFQKIINVYKRVYYEKITNVGNR